MNNNEYNKDNGNKVHNAINNIKKDSLENNEFPENNIKLKNSFNNLDNLDDYPLIDDENNNNFNNKIISKIKQKSILRIVMERNTSKIKMNFFLII